MKSFPFTFFSFHHPLPAFSLQRSGSIPEALRAADLSQDMRKILRCLQAVQGQVPGTDAARRIMRGELASLTTYFGYPLLFVTLNPADVLHPFTWRHALSTEPTPLPTTLLDQHLLEALRSAHLWRIVAQDPTAAVEAFHVHVDTFLRTLLDVPSTSQHLSADGLASQNGAGIFGPLSAVFGSIEPQQRGSLHIHLLLFCYGFQDPQSLLDRFISRLPLLEARLWDWIRSIVVTSFEAIPSVFGLPAASLQTVRPLPYSDANMMLMHPSYQHHLQASVDNWFAALPDQLLPATASSDHPFNLEIPADKPFVPFCIDYVQTLQYPVQPDEGTVLLFDLRTSVLYSGLLHSCQPRTCYKGKLGRRGYCRLGFWHWLQIEPHTWERCHGIQLCPRPLLGTTPPHCDTFQTERHHQFFGRVNPIILMACKCNHDVSTLLRFPADYAFVPDAATTICNRMSANMSTLLFYVTSYTTKTQPQLTSLWDLLHSATQKLQNDISSGTLDGQDPRARARTTLSRLLLSCQKRVHKSMQEMISYLLGHTDAYSTHSFHKLFFFHLAAQLEAAHPLAGSHLADTEMQARSALFLQPTADDPEPFNSPAVPGGAPCGPSFWSPSSDDYPFRGEDLQTWPLYFYAAGVARVASSKSALTTPGCIPFSPLHPNTHTIRQQVLTHQPWRIPHLMGPRIPSSNEDSERHALLLLLLFKPWMHIRDLLPASQGYSCWNDHFLAWLSALQAMLPSDNSRAPPFTPAYWAQRTLHIIAHIDNNSSADPATADRELRCNPDESRGFLNTITIESDLPPAPDDSDSDASDLDHLNTADFDLITQPVPAEVSSLL